MIQRFSFLYGDPRDPPSMVAHPEGMWVLYEEHLREIERLEEAHIDEIREQDELDHMGDM